MCFSFSFLHVVEAVVLRPRRSSVRGGRRSGSSDFALKLGQIATPSHKVVDPDLAIEDAIDQSCGDADLFTSQLDAALEQKSGAERLRDLSHRPADARELQRAGVRDDADRSETRDFGRHAICDLRRQQLKIRIRREDLERQHRKGDRRDRAGSGPVPGTGSGESDDHDDDERGEARGNPPQAPARPAVTRTFGASRRSSAAGPRIPACRCPWAGE